MKLLFPLIILFTSLISETLGNRCLDLNQSEGNCSECEPSNLLFQGKCYDKIRGCLEHKILGEKIKEINCVLCQNGYVLDELKCQRQAIVELRKGVPIQALNNPSPVISENANLDKQKIKVEGPQPPDKPAEVKVKSAQKFPEIKLARLFEEKNLNQKYQQIPSDLNKTISAIYPELSKQRCFKFTPTSLDNEVEKYLLVYEQGTILMVEKIQIRNANNLRQIAQGSEEVKYLVMKIGRSIKTKNQLNLLKSRKVSDSISTRLSINVEIKTKITQNSSFSNLDLLSGDFAAPSTQNQAQGTSTFLQMKKKEYEKSLQDAYAQFLKQIIVLNVPQNIVDVKVYENDNEGELIFKVVYVASNQSEIEYSVFKYNANRNETEVLGYFIEGANVLAYFNNSNQTNSSFANSTFVRSDVKSSAQVGEGSHRQNQSETPPRFLENKDILNTSNSSSFKNETTHINQSISNISLRANETQQKSQAKQNISQIQQQKKPIEVKSSGQNLRKQQSPMPPKVEQVKNDVNIQPEIHKPIFNFTTQVKSLNSILQILKSKGQFMQKIEKGYKVVSFETKIYQDKSQIVYSLKIFTVAGITLVKIIQNVEAKSFSESYSLQNSQNCLELPQNETFFTKLDSLMKKSYSMLQNFNKSSGQYKINENNEKYLLIYSNDQAKKVFYQVNKVKDTMKFSIAKSGVHQSGFYFQKKEMQSINIKISDFEQSKQDKCLDFKLIKPAINELVQRFKPFVNNSMVAAALTNTTHMKIYIQNKFSIYQFLLKITDIFGKGILNLVDKKYGYDVWPVGTKKAVSANSDANYQKIEEALLRKYKLYFNNGTNEILLKKSSINQYDVTFKTIFGYVCLTATLNPEVTLGLLKKNLDIDEPKPMQSCPSGQQLDKNDKKCYPKVNNCYRQIGNICISCQVGYIMQGDMKQCKKACSC